MNVPINEGGDRVQSHRAARSRHAGAQHDGGRISASSRLQPEPRTDLILDPGLTAALDVVAKARIERAWNEA